MFQVEKNEKPFEMTLAEVVEKQIRFLNDLAKSSLSLKEFDAVISVPIYFSQQQADFLKNCAQKAGFNIQRVMKNPIAACLCYDLEEDNLSEDLVLVYQMGGNSIEVSLVSVANGLFRLIDSIFLKDLGGDKFTDCVIDVLAEEFQK